MLREEQDTGESSFPLDHCNIALEKIEDEYHRSNEGDNKARAPNNDENSWSKRPCEMSTQEDTNGSHCFALNDLPERVLDVLKIAACLGSFDTRLLQVATSLSEEQLTGYLETAADKRMVKNIDGVNVFSSNVAEQDAYGLIPAGETRCHLHLTIGRSLVQNLSQDELEAHIYTVLLQFHCGMQAITNDSERIVIAALCLRAIRWAVAGSEFLAASNYSEFGILLLPPHHWKDEYDLSLALYNASAEVFHLAANYERVDELVSAVLENARCFRDTLHVRATRVHSLSATNRMADALREGLDILKHLGVRFPSQPRKYHATIELLRTKRLLRGKTNEMILRMPLMEDTNKIAAMQILNLIFPVAYHLNRILFVLINLRLVRLTMHYGMCAISVVGFAAYSAMLVTLYQNKDEGFRYSELTLELLDKFGTREYIPRVYYFVYAEALTFKYEIRSLYTYLIQAYQVGLESGDVQVCRFHWILCCIMMFSSPRTSLQYALYNSILVDFGFMLFSGDLIVSVEEKMRDYYKTAIAYKQDTALLMIRPLIRFLHILMGELERRSGAALEVDLVRARDGDDEFAAWAIHFLQVLLAYIFGDLETAATEAKEIEGHLRVHLHPGFSGVVTCHCLALLSSAPHRHGIARRRLMSKVKRSMKKLEQFSLCVPDNCLHKLNFVQAELAVVNGKYSLARTKYTETISRSTDLGVLWISALASERFAIFLEAQGDESGAAVKFRDAHSAYKSWGAIAKVQHLEKEMPKLFTQKSPPATTTKTDTKENVDDER